MKRFVGVVCAVLALVVFTVSVADAFPRLQQVQLVAKKAVSAAIVDSATFQIVANATGAKYDTLATIDTQALGLAFHGANAAGIATAYGAAKLEITVGSPTAGADSCLFQIQFSPDGSNWTTAQSSNVSYTSGDALIRLPITVDSDATTGISSAFLERYWRILIAGDTGGTFGGCKAYLSFFGESNQAPY